jgi:hypothetical protein
MIQEMVANPTQTNQDERDKEPKSSFQENEKNMALVRKVQKLFHKAKQHREKYDQNWLDYYKFFRGRQWKDERPDYLHSEVINMVFQTIQGQIPIMTDKKPQISYSAQEPEDFEFAKILDELASSDWDRYNWSMDLYEILLDGHLYGASFGNMGYDPDGEDGLGKITFGSQDNFYFYPDPNAIDTNKKCEYICIAEPMDIDIVKRKWPKKGKHVKPDIGEDHEDKTNLDKRKLRSPTENIIDSEQDGTPSTHQRQRALVITAYMKDDQFIEEEITKEDGSKAFQQKLKYPKGRKVVISNDIILQDGEMDFDDSQFPYSRYVNYCLPREFWGISEVENLMAPQKIFNKMVSFALDVMTLMGNPIWVVDYSSGIDTDNLINRPGLIVEKNPGSEARREEGVHLQPYVLQMIDRMREWFDGISGANDITRGVRPEGVTAAAAIEQLQDAAQTRIRQKSRNLDAFLQNIGQMYLSRVFQFYTVPRIIKMTGDQNANKYFRFQINQERDEKGNAIGEPVATVTNIEIGEEGPIEEEEKTFNIKGRFDVKVDTGSALPFSKVERESRAYQLFDRGLIDREAVFDMIDLPNKEAISQRMAQMEQQMAQAQAMQAGQAGQQQAI